MKERKLINRKTCDIIQKSHLKAVMINFLQDKFSLTHEQKDRINNFDLQLSHEELENFWLENPSLKFEDFCLWLESQEEIMARSSNYDLSIMTRFDSSMTEKEIIDKFCNSVGKNKS